MDENEPTGVELSGKKKSARAKRFVVAVLIAVGVIAAAAITAVCLFIFYKPS